MKRERDKMNIERKRREAMQLIGRRREREEEEEWKFLGKMRK